MSKVDQNGKTVKENLEQVERQVGRKPKELESRPFPQVLGGVWSAFLALCNTRTYHANGPNPISYLEIDGYIKLTQTPLRLRDITVIKKLDQVYLRIANE